MTAIDVSHLVEASADSPDLRAFKAFVYERAQKGKSAYGFCSQIDRELEILGIKKERPVTIRVTTSHPFVLDVKVLPSKLLDKTEDEQKAILVAAMGQIRIAGENLASASFAIPVESIVEMELKTITRGQSSGEGRAPRDGYYWTYVSSEGRVMHEVQIRREGSQSRWSYTACGQEHLASRFTATPSHPSGRHCKKCEAVSG